MMQRRNPLDRARGFTLIELLISVGIIAILLAVLIPALNSARKRAQTVRCLSNQRSLMQAMLSYASDNDGYLPPPNWDGGLSAPPGSAVGWLYDPSVVVAAGGFAQNNSQTGVLYSYINSVQMYRCYVDDGNWGSNTVQVVTSHMMNGAVCDYGNGAQPEKLRAFKSTSILLWEIPVDLGGDTGLVNDGGDWPAEGITTRHNNGSTVGFVDGHAEVWPWTQYVNAWYAPGTWPGQLWCAPKYSDGGRGTWTAGHGWPNAPPPQPPGGS